MNPLLARRQFLHGAAGLASAIAWGTSTADAIEPIRRNGTPQFQFSLAAYSYRNLLSGKNASLSLSDFIDDCARFGLDGTELTSYYFPNPTTPEYLRGLKQQCFRLGLAVSGTAVGNDFGHPAGDVRTKQIEALKQWIRNAEILGAPVIRVFAGHTPKGLTDAEAYKNMVAGLEECSAYAGEHGVFLALENHGGPTSTADGLLAFVKDVNSPWFGVNMDTGNFHSEDVYGELERIAPYSINVQVKVVVMGPEKKKVPSDFKRLAKMLRNVGYRGYVVLEYEEAGDPREESPRFLEQIREAFA